MEDNTIPKKECGDCVYYSNAVCANPRSKDIAADRDSHHTCDIDKFKLKEKK